MTCSTISWLINCRQKSTDSSILVQLIKYFDRDFPDKGFSPSDMLLILRKHIVKSGKRILIVDDVISTGGSLKAMEHLVEMAGGTVTGRIAVLAEGDAAERDDIKFLAPLPLFNADGSVKD